MKRTSDTSAGNVLFTIFSGTALVMFLYELAKESIAVGTLTSWESHAITIAVTSSLATLTGFLLRRRILEVEADKRAILEQHQEELRLAASVFHNSAEGVLITDADSHILSINPAFTFITGYTAEDAVGQNPNLLRSTRHEPEFYRSMWHALQDEGQWQGEIWNRRKDGEAYLQWMTINRITDHNGATFRYVCVFHDVTETRRKDERIRHLAFHDALTNLPNRALFQERLVHAVDRLKREKGRLSVSFIDLDGFKAVNDKLGHGIGDQLLQEVAQRIQARMRRSVDTVARLGGDEFVILMEDVDKKDDCTSLAAEIINHISKPITLQGHSITVGASIGIAFFPEDADTATELMKHADTAMYAAKAEGKGTYRIHSTEMCDMAEIPDSQNVQAHAG